MVAERHVRRTVKEWFQERIEGQSTVSLPELKLEAVAHFKDDAPFLAALVEETVPSILYEISAQVVSASRGQLVRVGDEIEPREQFKQRARRAGRFFDWLEHAGERHVRLLDMEQGDLLEAAQERRKRSYTELRYATLWETMAASMEAGQKVRDVFSPEEIEKLYASLDESQTREGEAIS